MKPGTSLVGILALLAAGPLAAADKDTAQESAGSSEAASGVAQDTGKPGSDIVVQGQKDDDDKPICHREMVTGSIRSVRVCMSKAEREERKRQSEQVVSEISDRQRTQQRVNDAKNGAF